MKKLWTGLILGGFVAASAIGFAQPAHAEDEQQRTEISISPTMAVISMVGGDTIAQGSEKCPKNHEAGCVVEIKNTGTTAYNFRVHVTPYAVSGQNNDIRIDEAASNAYSQISRWISFLDESGNYVEEYTGRLNPGETRLVPYRVDVPDDIPGGAQYAAIWAQTLSDGANGSVQTTGEAGMTIFGRSTGDTRRTGEISNYGLQRFSLGGSLGAHAKVKNTGNTDYEIRYNYTARTIFGKELHSESGKLAAWPESEYEIKTDWTDTPLLGVFNVDFSVEAADTTRNEHHIVVVMPIIVMILLISLLTVIVIWIIIIVRKRKERKARTLV